MINVVDFPTVKTEDEARAKHIADCDCWFGVEFAAQRISKILHDVTVPADLTDDQRFELQDELRYMLVFVHDDAFKDLLLSKREYQQRLDLRLRPCSGQA